MSARVWIPLLIIYLFLLVIGIIWEGPGLDYAFGGSLPNSPAAEAFGELVRTAQEPTRVDNSSYRFGIDQIVSVGSSFIQFPVRFITAIGGVVLLDFGYFQIHPLLIITRWVIITVVLVPLMIQFVIVMMQLISAFSNAAANAARALPFFR